MSELARGSPKSSRTLLECASKAREVFPSLMLSTLDSATGLRSASGGLQGLSRGTPGRSWVALGVLLGCSRGSLGRSWALLGSSCASTFPEIRKILPENSKFCVFWALRALGRPPSDLSWIFGPSASRFWLSGEGFGGLPSSNSIAEFGKVLLKSWRDPGENHRRHSQVLKRMKPF